MDEAKLCTLFSLVPRASVSSRDQRALCRCWSYCILLLGYLFSSLQMVSGQQILEACMKNFVIVLRLVVHIQVLREIGFEDLKAWIHICLPSVIFIFISERERLFYFDKEFVHQFFYHFSKIQTRREMNETQGHLVEFTKCTFEKRLMPPLQILLFEALLSLALSPA